MGLKEITESIGAAGAGLALLTSIITAVATTAAAYAIFDVKIDDLQRRVERLESQSSSSGNPVPDPQRQKCADLAEQAANAFTSTDEEKIEKAMNNLGCPRLL